MTLQEKQEAMRRKYEARRTARQAAQYRRMIATKARREADREREKSPAMIIRRRVPGDLSTATLDKMEAMLYRIAKRKACIGVPRLASIPVTHLQPK